VVGVMLFLIILYLFAGLSHFVMLDEHLVGWSKSAMLGMFLITFFLWPIGIVYALATKKR
jgi:hypothetical protein